MKNERFLPPSCRSDFPWHKGVLCVRGLIVEYEVKVYEVGSVHGINGGRISKLWMSIEDEMVASYDRGWNLRPSCEEAQEALAILLEKYKEA